MADFSSPEPTPNPAQGWVLGQDAGMVIEEAAAASSVPDPIRTTFAAGWWLEYGEPCASGTCPTGFDGG